MLTMGIGNHAQASQAAFGSLQLQNGIQSKTLFWANQHETCAKEFCAGFERVTEDRNGCSSDPYRVHMPLL
jgi:hypothetical protein